MLLLLWSLTLEPWRTTRYLYFAVSDSTSLIPRIPNILENVASGKSLSAVDLAMGVASQTPAVINLLIYLSTASLAPSE